MANQLASTPPPATVAQVANEFLSLASRDGLGGTIDQMKLQKLLFYAHAWHLGYERGPLFENDFEAWPWGPVVRAIYLQTRDYRRGPISGFLTEFLPSAEGYKATTPEGVADALKPFIESVWGVLKPYSGVQLSNSTHAAGEPWTIVAEAQGTDSKPIIPNTLIAQVFAGKLNDGNKTAAA